MQLYCMHALPSYTQFTFHWITSFVSVSYRLKFNNVCIRDNSQNPCIFLELKENITTNLKSKMNILKRYAKHT